MTDADVSPEVPDEERAEELLKEEDEQPRAVAEPEVPEADAQEQASVLRRGENERPASGWDIPEADSIEQARSAYDEEDEDDYR